MRREVGKIVFENSISFFVFHLGLNEFVALKVLALGTDHLLLLAHLPLP